MKKKIVPLTLMVSSGQEDIDLARRRYQRPKPYRDGNYWKIRVYEDALNENGKLYRSRPEFIVGPCVGPHALSQRQAEREAYDKILRTMDAYTSCPQSVVSFEQFVTQRFLPLHVGTLKHAGKEHYKYCLSKLLLRFGSERLRDISGVQIQQFLLGLLEKGCSTQTAKHLKTALGAVFQYAKENNFYSGDNPVSSVVLPPVVSAERYAYSFDEAQRVLAALPAPVRQMVFLALTTSLNVAELCGLRWKRVNLSDKSICAAGEAVPPFSLHVRENYYRNRWGTVKSKSRRRTVGLADFVVAQLAVVQEAATFTKPDDPVFASRAGTPLDAHNINNRLFKAAAKEAGVPITWHIFRHSAATFAEVLNMPMSDREKLLGHAAATMTMHYTHSDVERRRKVQNEIAERLLSDREKQMRALMDAKIPGVAQ